MRGLDHIPSFDSDKSWGVFRNEKGAAAQDKRLRGEPYFALTPRPDGRARVYCLSELLRFAGAGSVNVRYSPEYGPPLTATTMYCFPFSRYVIGDPLCGAGM